MYLESKLVHESGLWRKLNKAIVSVTDYTYSPTSVTVKALGGAPETEDYIQSTLHQNHSDLSRLDNEWESRSD
jgi:hypothetical protein